MLFWSYSFGGSSNQTLLGDFTDVGAPILWGDSNNGAGFYYVGY